MQRQIFRAGREAKVHEAIRATRRYYVKVQPELLEEARRILEKALASCTFASRPARKI